MNRSSPAYILGFVAIVAAVLGVAVSAVHYGTLDMMRTNERLHRNRVIAEAFMIDVPGEQPAEFARVLSNRVQTAVVESDGRSRRVYRLRGGDRDAIGFDVSGMGFWDRITGLLVLTPDREEIVNLAFFDHKETPGLGARIEEPWFKEQFRGLAIDWQAPEEERIRIGGPETPGAGNRVDAITGATQTSMALDAFLNDELERIRRMDIDAVFESGKEP